MGGLRCRACVLFACQLTMVIHAQTLKVAKGQKWWLQLLWILTRVSWLHTRLTFQRHHWTFDLSILFNVTLHTSNHRTNFQRYSRADTRRHDSGRQFHARESKQQHKWILSGSTLLKGENAWMRHLRMWSVKRIPLCSLGGLIFNRKVLVLREMQCVSLKVHEAVIREHD